MREFQTKRSSSGLGRRGALVATLAVLLLGTAGFAVAGGVELVRSWFVTLEINGETVDVELADITVETGGDTATLTLDIGELDVEVEEGTTATITLTAIEYDPEEDSQSAGSDTTESETDADDIEDKFEE